MHISLDSALGRQRRLNQVGETISSIAAPTAAYSLRSLTGGDPKVVRVRRGSDNHEQDFTASEVSSGALVDFVNTQVIAPLDIQALTSTGRDGDFLIAKAAYSLRSLGTRQATVAATGDTVARANGKYVCQVRSVTGDIKSFTADEVSDGTLVDFVLGNTKSLLNSRAFFDGSDDNVRLTSDITLSGDFSIQYSFVVTEQATSQRILGRLTTYYIGAEGTGEITRFKAQVGSSGVTMNLTSNLKFGEANTIKFKRVSGKVGIYDESDTLISNEVTASGDFVVNSFGRARGQLARGVIYNIRIDTNNDGTINHSYNGYGNTLSDWQDLVGSNNASAVNGSPALFTGQDQNGFVRTWYDQSVTTQAGDTATGNHATQATASKQPLIVEGGSLNVDSFSNPTIRFEKDSETHLVTTNETLDPNLEVSAFVVQKDEQVVNQNSGWVAMRRSDSSSRSSAFEMGVNNNSTQFRLIYDPLADDTNKDDILVTVASDGLGTTSIMSGIKTSSGDLDGFFNASSVIDTTVTDNTDLGSGYGITMGKHNNSTQFADGRLNEVIFYLSDQTDNRTAIEANMGEHYSISGIPAFDNSVNGFVETWYDQSGNGNDVVQATAANQPKIVNAGSYLGALLFDGSDFFLASFSNPFTSDSFTASVVNFKTTSGRETVFDYRASTPYVLECNSSARLNIETSGNFNDSSVTITDNQDNLLVTSTDSSDTLLGVDGTTATKSGRAVSSGSASLNIGRNGFAGGINHLNGDMKEIIIYATDQRSNRVAIETNINNHYSIF
jgi:hypothetical protein